MSTQPTSPETESLRQVGEAPDRLAELDNDPQADAELRLAAVEREVVQAEYDDAARPEHRARVRAGQRADAARDYRNLRERLVRRADDKAAAAAGIAREDSPDWDAYWKLSGEATHNLVVAERLEGRERELRKGAYVKYEAPPYGPDASASWFCDVALVRNVSLTGSLPDSRLEQAQQRLARHAKDVADAYWQPGAYGKQVRAIIRDEQRGPDPTLHKRHLAEREKALAELRTTGTGGGATASASGGQAVAFVPPNFVLERWAAYRGYGRPFADQCLLEDLPAFGMHLYIPYWSTTDKVAAQTEGSSITEASPEASLEGGKVETFAGVVVITQQLADKAYAGNGTFDQQLGREIQERLDQEIEAYTLKVVIENGEGVSGNAEAFKLEKFLEDVAKCREKLTDGAGVRLKPIVMFTTSDLFSYVTHQCEKTTERPMFTLPLNTPGFPKDSNADSEPGQPDPVWSRYQGIQMPGNVVWMTSEGMPTKGTTNQTTILISAPEKAVALFESAPMCEVIPEQYANELRVVVRLREYAAVVTRFKAGSAYVQSAAYTTALV